MATVASPQPRARAAESPTCRRGGQAGGGTDVRFRRPRHAGDHAPLCSAAVALRDPRCCTHAAPVPSPRRAGRPGAGSRHCEARWRPVSLSVFGGSRTGSLAERSSEVGATVQKGGQAGPAMRSSAQTRERRPTMAGDRSRGRRGGLRLAPRKIRCRPALAVEAPRISRRALALVGAPDRIRTCDPRIRNPMLYPAELRAPAGIYISRALPSARGHP